MAVFTLEFGHYKLLPFIGFVFNLLKLSYHYMYQPYRDFNIQQLEFRLTLTNFCISFIFMVGQFTSQSLDFLFCLAVCIPLSYLLGKTIIEFKLRQTDQREIEKSENTLSNIDLLLRFLASNLTCTLYQYIDSYYSIYLESIVVKHHKICTNYPNCFCKKYQDEEISRIEFIGENIRRQYLEYFIKNTYIEECKLIKAETSEFHFSYYAFLINWTKNQTVSLREVLSLRQRFYKKASIRQRQIITYLYELASEQFKLKQQQKFIQNNGQIYDIISFDTCLDDSSKLYVQCLKEKQEILLLISKDHINILQLEKLAINLQEKRVILQQEITRLFRLNSFSHPLLSICEGFEECLTFEPIFRKMYVHQVKTGQRKNGIKFYSDDSCAIYISLLTDIGKIQKVSKNFRQVIPLIKKNEDAIGKNVNFMMCEEIAHVHNNILLNFVQKNSKIQDIKHYPFIIGRNSDGWAVPYEFKVQLCMIGFKEIGACGWLKQINDGNSYVMASSIADNCRIFIYDQKFYSTLFKKNFNRNQVKMIRLGCLMPIMKNLGKKGQDGVVYESIIIKPNYFREAMIEWDILDKSLLFNMFNLNLYQIKFTFYQINSQFIKFTVLQILSLRSLSQISAKKEAIRNFRLQIKEFVDSDQLKNTMSEQMSRFNSMNETTNNLKTQTNFIEQNSLSHIAEEKDNNCDSPNNRNTLQRFNSVENRPEFEGNYQSIVNKLINNVNTPENKVNTPQSKINTPQHMAHNLQHAKNPFYNTNYHYSQFNTNQNSSSNGNNSPYQANSFSQHQNFSNSQVHPSLYKTIGWPQQIANSNQINHSHHKIPNSPYHHSPFYTNNNANNTISTELDRKTYVNGTDQEYIYDAPRFSQNQLEYQRVTHHRFVQEDEQSKEQVKQELNRGEHIYKNKRNIIAGMFNYLQKPQNNGLGGSLTDIVQNNNDTDSKYQYEANEAQMQQYPLSPLQEGVQLNTARNGTYHNILSSESNHFSPLYSQRKPLLLPDTNRYNNTEALEYTTAPQNSNEDQRENSEYTSYQRASTGPRKSSLENKIASQKILFMPIEENQEYSENKNQEPFSNMQLDENLNSDNSNQAEGGFAEAKRKINDDKEKESSMKSGKTAKQSSRQHLINTIRKKSNSKGFKIINMLGIISIIFICLMNITSYFIQYDDMLKQKSNFQKIFWVYQIKKYISLVFSDYGLQFCLVNNIYDFIKTDEKLQLYKQIEQNSKSIYESYKEYAQMISEPNSKDVYVFQLADGYPIQLVFMNIQNSKSQSLLNTTLSYEILFFQKLSYYIAYNQSANDHNMQALLNYLNLFKSLEEVYKKNLESFNTQIKEIVISVVTLALSLMMIPVQIITQKQRKDILKLFSTFSPDKLFTMIQTTIKHLEYQERISLNKQKTHPIRGDTRAFFQTRQFVTTPNIKQNQSTRNSSFFSTAAQQVLAKNIQNMKKKNISSTTDIPKFTFRIFIGILFGLISMQFYGISKYIIGQYQIQNFQQSLNFLASFDYFFDNMASQIIARFALPSTMIIANKYQFDISDYLEITKVQQKEARGKLQNLMDQFNNYESYSGDQEQEVKQFLLPMFKDNICDTLNNDRHNYTDDIQIDYQVCKSIYGGVLQKGLFVASQKYLQFFDSYAEQAFDYNFIKLKQSLIKQYDQITVLEEYNFSIMLMIIVRVVHTFFQQGYQQNFDKQMTISILLLAIQLLILLIVLTFGWRKYYLNLGKQIYRTKQLIDLIDINILLDNPYVVSYFKRNS